jgi:hypothetical protein
MFQWLCTSFSSPCISHISKVWRCDPNFDHASTQSKCDEKPSGDWIAEFGWLFCLCNVRSSVHIWSRVVKLILIHLRKQSWSSGCKKFILSTAQLKEQRLQLDLRTCANQSKYKHGISSTWKTKTFNSEPMGTMEFTGKRQWFVSSFDDASTNSKCEKPSRDRIALSL